VPEILFRGDPPPKYRWMGVWRCDNCKTVVRLTEADHGCVDYTSDQRDGEFLRLKEGCPVCHKTTDAIFYRHETFADKISKAMEGATEGKR
jgi:hypothetical protein